MNQLAIGIYINMSGTNKTSREKRPFSIYMKSSLSLSLFGKVFNKIKITEQCLSFPSKTWVLALQIHMNQGNTKVILTGTTSRKRTSLFSKNIFILYSESGKTKTNQKPKTV